MRLTDELLLKYADGLLDDETERKISALLEQDEIAAGRVRLMRASGDALKNEKSGDGASEFPLQDIEARIAGSVGPDQATEINAGKPRKFAMAACIAGLVGGIGLGVIAPRLLNTQTHQDLTQFPTWIVRVVDYHTLYVRETLKSASSTADQVAAYEARFSRVLSEPLVIPNLSEHALDFRRAQLLKFESVPIVQLGYMPDAEGRPVALCIRPASVPDHAPRFDTIRGMGTVRWSNAGLEYILVGYLPRERLMQSAQTAIKGIAERT